jgi:hypothetical protein
LVVLRIEPRTSGLAARNSDHYTTEAAQHTINKVIKEWAPKSEGNL